MRMIGAVYNEFSPGAFFIPVSRDSFDVIFFVNRTSASQENSPVPRQVERDFGQG